MNGCWRQINQGIGNKYNRELVPKRTGACAKYERGLVPKNNGGRGQIGRVAGAKYDGVWCQLRRVAISYGSLSVQSFHHWKRKSLKDT
jgi:hypothetical protein